MGSCACPWAALVGREEGPGDRLPYFPLIPASWRGVHTLLGVTGGKDRARGREKGFGGHPSQERPRQDGQCTSPREEQRLLE